MARAKKKTKSDDEAQKAAPVAESAPEETRKDESKVPEGPPKEHKPMVAFSLNRARAVKHAVPSADVVHTAIATKTCTRFVGGWIVLEAGEEVKARKDVIESLRLQGLVR
jgi:hypothetical protein